jgi:hypothetical protein
MIQQNHSVSTKEPYEQIIFHIQTFSIGRRIN